jgi:hypothetical protein
MVKLHGTTSDPHTATHLVKNWPNGLYESKGYPNYILTVKDGKGILWSCTTLDSYPVTMEHTEYIWTKLPDGTSIDISLELRF